LETLVKKDKNIEFPYNLRVKVLYIQSFNLHFILFVFNLTSKYQKFILNVVRTKNKIINMLIYNESLKHINDMKYEINIIFGERDFNF